MRVGERRDGALLGNGCGKRRAMAAGAQAILAQHAGVTRGGGAGGKRRGCGRIEVQSGRRSFLGAADVDIRCTEMDCIHGCPDAGVRTRTSVLYII
jgi:hypothetical protein